MKTTKTITINGEQITATELDVAQIDQAVGSFSADERFDKVCALIGAKVGPGFITQSTGLDHQRLGSMLPSELVDIVAVVEEVNCRFLALALPKSDPKEKGLPLGVPTT